MNPFIESNQGDLLIIDDTLENLQVLSATLSQRGYKVRCANNATMGLRVARSAFPDLILLDVKMPDMSGYEVCQHLKNDSNTCKIPIIFISALDEVQDKVKAFHVGGEDYITKPFHVEEVLARVEHQLTIRRLQQQLQTQNEQLQQEVIERKKAEKAAEAASKAKSEFLANMSHEFRTPLNIILGFTQMMLRDEAITVEQSENLQTIHRSGQHLLELVNDILDLSKIEAGIISLDETSFDLYYLIDQLEEMFLLTAIKKSLQLYFQVEPNVPQYIKTDEKKLRSCLINIINNALKFTNLGHVMVRVRCQDDPDQSLTKNEPFILQFEVEDTGCGIAHDQLETIFEAFSQTEAGQQAAEGTGLGLTITRKFIQLMGGEITVKSTLNQGTTFCFDIRAQPVKALEASLTILHKVVGLEPNQPAYRILVVDDTKDNRSLLVKLLQPIGFEVREAENGQQALKIWQSWHPHFIWMDTRMPMMDGNETTRQIRTQEQEQGIIWTQNSLPQPALLGSFRQATLELTPTIIIGITATTFDKTNSHDILAVGYNDLIHKPFTETLIFAKLIEHLGVRYAYQEHPQPQDSHAFNPYKFDALVLPHLPDMPQSWLKALFDAANEVNEELVLQLILQIPSEFDSLAQTLTDLFNEARFDLITRQAQLVLQS